MRTTLYMLDKNRFESVYWPMPRHLPLAQWQDMLAQGEKHCELAEAIDELAPEDARMENGQVLLSGTAVRILLESCKADCVISSYEIGATDFFFADLAANPPGQGGLGGGAQAAWETFCKVVDIGAAHRQALPWWLDRAAYSRCAYAGLLSPDQARLVGEFHRELGLWLAGHLTGAAERKDAECLLSLATEAAASGNWLMGWEPGT